MFSCRVRLFSRRGPLSLNLFPFSVLFFFHGMSVTPDLLFLSYFLRDEMMT